MQREQANPTGGVDRVGMRMMTGFRNSRRDIVDGDKPVKHRDDDEEYKTQRKIIKARIVDRVNHVAYLAIDCGTAKATSPCLQRRSAGKKSC
jgi:hypothetical protein